MRVHERVNAMAQSSHDMRQSVPAPPVAALVWRALPLPLVFSTLAAIWYVGYYRSVDEVYMPIASALIHIGRQFLVVFALALTVQAIILALLCVATRRLTVHAYQYTSGARWSVLCAVFVAIVSFLVFRQFAQVMQHDIVGLRRILNRPMAVAEYGALLKALDICTSPPCLFVYVAVSTYCSYSSVRQVLEGFRAIATSSCRACGYPFVSQTSCCPECGTHYVLTESKSPMACPDAASPR